MTSPRRCSAVLLAIFALAGCGYSNVPPPTDAGTTPPPSTGPKDGGGSFCVDNDGDGIPGTGDCASAAAVDCDDANPSNSPGRAEICDDLDNDCDGAADEGLELVDHFVDGDGDGYGSGAATKSCHPMLAERVTKGGDCNDAEPLIHPNAPEACNGKDDDCDNTIDDNITFQSFYPDLDGDGFGAGTAEMSCQASLPGKVTKSGDCDDTKPLVNPNATEVCNGLDDNCDQKTDDSFPGKDAACQTGLGGPCAGGTMQCVSAAEKCVGAVQPTTETCNGVDNDCDGATDETFANKGMSCNVGQGVCAAMGTFVCNSSGTATQCSATAGSPTAAACDGLDNDCDGLTDETEVENLWSLTSSDPTDIDIAPFFFTSSSCNGGQGSSGTDAWQHYYSAYVVGGDLHVQKLDNDGFPSGMPLDISTFTSNQEVAAVQMGGGIAVVGRFGSSYLDLYFVGPGPTARTIGGAGFANIYYASGATLSNLRVVRGNGGRLVVLWRETTSTSSRIRMARFSLALSSGNDYTLTTVTAPKDLIAVAGSTGAFGVASSHAEYGDQTSCPTGLAKFGVAHVVASGASTRTVYFETFTEDGAAVGLIHTVHSVNASGMNVGDPDVAWANVSGDRWAVVHTASTSSAEALHFWHSGGGVSLPVASSHTGSGADSVREARVVARDTEFLYSALVYSTSDLTKEPQVWVGKKSHGGTTNLTWAAATQATSCTSSNCTNGTRKAVRPFSNASGSFKGAGGIIFAGSVPGVRAGKLGCN